ncbi:MAG: hypothetical protein AAGI08_10980 [Bacteroidota bacterium]
MNTFDKQLQPGSTFRVLLFGGCTLLFAVLAVTEPEQRYVSLLLMTLGMLGTWRTITVRKQASAAG